MQIDTSTITKSWKTTTLGVCLLLLASLKFLHFDTAGHLAMTARDWCGCAVGTLGFVVGALSTDAGNNQ